ncbi:hypothetical protein [Chitinilyticum litopenaei]|uniref:hypothetical protein n=1 Tax=Chitinilyticum litopenaei TaxID=1121276 RepID=UPI0003F8A214|nr:hypothetical protein [Chitinilyticum litopenaei]
MSADHEHVWLAIPASQEPETVLTAWRIFEVRLEDQSRVLRLVGYCGYEGRVSSPVTAVGDPAQRQYISRSGRRYQLSGPPGYHPDAMYVYERIAALDNQLGRCWRDVTDQGE